ncbi:MAG: PIG-L deacetylase family protein [Pyrinomonadaceae bacterium]
MKTALIIAPHPDDETLGAGGTIRRLADAGYRVAVVTVAAHMPPLYTAEVHERTVAESKNAQAVLGVRDSVFLDRPAVCLGEIPTAEFNKLIQDQVDAFSPEVLLIPFPDRHIDHKLIFEACMVAARPIRGGRKMNLVAAYETISETHWNAPHIEPTFIPTLCVDISEVMGLKMEAIRCFESQLHAFPGPRSIEALRALALFRGSQAGYGYGEAFHVIRMGSGLFI